MPAIILSTVCICMAGMFVLIDLGGIQRVWRILTGPNPTSPLLWDVCVITCYLIINVFYLVFRRAATSTPCPSCRASRFPAPSWCTR